MSKILIGDISFFEDTQDDYQESYTAYNVDKFNATNENVHFAVVHNILETLDDTEENLDMIEERGLSYLIPSKYNGVIIYDNNRTSSI